MCILGSGLWSERLFMSGKKNSNRNGAAGGIGSGLVEGFLEEGYNPMIKSSDLRLTRMPLNNGAGHMPALGFGTLIPDTAVTKTATKDALDAGFRHFDCAERYRNEHEVGEALEAGLAANGIA